MNAEVRLAERVAVLEEQQRQQAESNAKILGEIREIRSELTRYKGFIGGVSFVFSCIVVFLSIFKGWIFGKS